MYMKHTKLEDNTKYTWTIGANTGPGLKMIIKREDKIISQLHALPPGMDEATAQKFAHSIIKAYHDGYKAGSEIRTGSYWYEFQDFMQQEKNRGLTFTHLFEMFIDEIKEEGQDDFWGQDDWPE